MDNMYILKNDFRYDTKCGSRLTIGFLDENGNDEYHGYITEGVYEAARKYNANVIRIGHFTSNDTFAHEAQADVIWDMIDQFKLDGLLFLGWARAAAHDIGKFRNRFAHIPLFSLGAGHDNIPSAFYDSGIYINELLTHLINVHKFKRIAFISPFWPDGRTTVYTDFMKENGIYDPDLFISTAELANLEVPDRGRKAVSILLDDRKTKVEAIVSLFNAETEGIINELNARGLNVPDDIAVTSYEDGEVGKYFTPSFTTIYFPWKELGYISCETFIKLLLEGQAPLITKVPGRFIIRNSCGCISQSISLINADQAAGRSKSIHDLDSSEFKEIVEAVYHEIGYSHLNVESLINALVRDLCSKSDTGFIKELELQFSGFTGVYNLQSIENIVSIIRNKLIPHIMNNHEELILAEDIFLQAQIIVREKVMNIWGNDQLQFLEISRNLEEVSVKLLKSFSMQSLIDTLEANLSRLWIRHCCIFIRRDSDNDNPSGSYYTAFEYRNGTRAVCKTDNPESVRERLNEMFNGEDRPVGLMANLLHINEEFLGFVLFEPGPTDERVYHALGIHISTALSGAILFEKLDENYRKLVTNAHTEGMTNVITGILHNIRNVLNSINTSTYLIKDLIGASQIDDLIRAVSLLEENAHDIKGFMSGEKGKKLMQFITRLEEPLQAMHNEMDSSITRLGERTDMINGILTAQENYEGSKGTMEEYEAAAIVEDVLKMNLSSLEKRGISVARNFRSGVRISVQKAKLFHILMNLIKNSIEAMEGQPADDRKLTISISRDSNFEYIRITDTGCGIPQNLLKSVFAYGYTTKANGHGFGLHSCANYMTEMNGKMWAESEGPGRGATFVLQFGSI